MYLFFDSINIHMNVCQYKFAAPGNTIHLFSPKYVHAMAARRSKLILPFLTLAIFCH